MSLLFDESLQKIKFLFKISGLHLERTILNTIGEIIRFRWLYIINFLWLNTDVLGEILWIIDGALSGKPLLKLTYIAPCTTLCMLGNIKTLCLIHNEGNIKELFKNLRAMENITNNNRYKDKIVDEEKTFLMAVISAMNISNAVTVTAFNLSPLLLMALAYQQTGQIELILPFLIKYPFDSYNIKYWPFVYIHQIWSAWVVILGLGGADSLFYICCSCICTQFRLLQHDIESLIPERAFDESVFQDKFKKIVARHQAIIRSVTLLETIYTKSTLYNFVSSSFLICLTGFNVTVCCSVQCLCRFACSVYGFTLVLYVFKYILKVIDDIAILLSFVSFLLLSLLQIFLLCYFGDMIMTSSMNVSNAMYNSKWYLVNAKTAKQLFMVQTRAQKPCKLTASSYADVNLRAFTRILSTAWSYFALLKTVYSSPRV